jgi:hypothetical protein
MIKRTILTIVLATPVLFLLPATASAADADDDGYIVQLQLSERQGVM